MLERRLIQVLAEGDDDRAVLEGLRKIELLPSRVEIAKKTKNDGHTAVVAGAAARAEAGIASIAMIDLDHHPAPANLAQWVAARMRERLRSPGAVVEVLREEARVPLLQVRIGDLEAKTAVVAVGLAGDAELRAAYALETFAVDDFLLRVVRDREIFEGISDQDPIPHAAAMDKLDRTITLLRTDDGHAVRITKAKRVLFLLRAIADFRAAPASFAGRLIDVAAQKTDRSGVRALFEPLVGDIETAVTLIEG